MKNFEREVYMEFLKLLEDMADACHDKYKGYGYAYGFVSAAFSDLLASVDKATVDTWRERILTETAELSAPSE